MPRLRWRTCDDVWRSNPTNPPLVPHKLFQVGQKAFIEKDGRVLVVFFPNGWLDFPGGRIDEGEPDIVEALRREVREETTLEVEVGDPFATWLGRENTVYLVGYRCRYVSGEVRLSDEHVSYRWVGREDYEDVDDGSAPFEALRRCFEMGLCSPGDAEADLKVCSYIFLDAGVRVPLLICA